MLASDCSRVSRWKFRIKSPTPTRSSPWISELNMIKREILTRLNEGRELDSRIEKLVFVLADG